METTGQRSPLAYLGVLSGFLGIVFVYVFYKQSIGANFTLFVLAIIGCGIFLSHIFRRKITAEMFSLLGISFLFSFFVFFRSSELLTFLNILGSIMLLCITIRLYTGKQFREFWLRDYILSGLVPFQFIGPFFSTLSKMLADITPSKNLTRTREVLRGTVAAVIVFLIFSWLFSSADEVFKQLFLNIFDISLNQDVINKTILWSLVSAFFVGGFGYMFVFTHHTPKEQTKTETRTLGELETRIVLGTMVGLFLLFIIIQISSLFGGTAHLLANGLTYAQYAREGFFQLIWVAVLAYLIVSFAESQVVKTDKGHFPIFRTLSTILVGEVLAILISAFSRLSLYEAAYGFTTIRLYSHVFMLWTGTLLVLFCMHIWREKPRSVFIFRAALSAVFFLLAMNILNPDAFIANMNMERYRETGKVDALYLGSLSIDALPYTIGLLQDHNLAVRDMYILGLRDNERFCELLPCEREKWRDWQSHKWGVAQRAALVAPYNELFLSKPQEKSTDTSTTTEY